MRRLTAWEGSMTKIYPALTTIEFSALRAFARRQGRFWKRDLLQMWQSASYPLHCQTSNTAGTLQALRNTHGPGWLQHFHFSKRKPPEAGIPMRNMRDFDRL